MTYTNEQLATAVKESKSFREVSLRLGRCAKGGGAYISLRKRISNLQLDTSHFLGQKWMKGRKKPDWAAKPISYYLQLDGPAIANQVLKKRLIKEGLKKDVCEKCGQPPFWNNKPLVLQIDHLNGNSRDNRIENLCVICPHCHSQTATFCGKNKRVKKETIINTNNEWRKRPKLTQRKVVRPSADELRCLLKDNTWTFVGEKFGVTDNAVRKWIKSYGIAEEVKNDKMAR